MMQDEVHKAASYLQSGQVILYPTDTIWGIGCDATNDNAVQRIYQIKQRSDSKSMLVLVNGIEMLSNYLDQIPDIALEIIKSAVKPTTIIYPGARGFSEGLLADDHSIGIRITSDSFCQELIAKTGKPIVSTSANMSGDPSPSSFKDISGHIRNNVDFVVNWKRKETQINPPSTIIKIERNGEIIVIRP